MKFKFFILSILLSTVFITVLFPIEFSGGLFGSGNYAISFHIYLFFVVIMNLFLMACSFISDEFVRKITSSKHLLIEVIMRLCIYSFVPVTFFCLLTKEVRGIVLMILITVVTYVLLEVSFSKRIKKYDVEKVMYNLFYYGLIMLIALIVASMLMVEVI